MKLAKTTDAKKKKEQGMALKRLMEGIILQSFADLWITREKDDCIKFFRGEGFKICADIADINLHDQVKLLDFANRTIDLQAANRARQKNRTNRKDIISLEKSCPQSVKLPPVAKAVNFQGVCSI